jgi:hypothetical protein
MRTVLSRHVRHPGLLLALYETTLYRLSVTSMI